MLALQSTTFHKQQKYKAHANFIFMYEMAKIRTEYLEGEAQCFYPLCFDPLNAIFASRDTGQAYVGQSPSILVKYKKKNDCGLLVTKNEFYERSNFTLGFKSSVLNGKSEKDTLYYSFSFTFSNQGHDRAIKMMISLASCCKQCYFPSHKSQE